MIHHIKKRWFCFRKITFFVLWNEKNNDICTMKIYKAFFCFFLLINVCLAQKNDIFQVEKARFDACILQDSIGLERLLHDDLTYVHSNSLQETKRDFIHSVSSGDIRYQSFEIVTQNARRLNAKTYIINGELLVKGLFKTYPYNVTLKYTSVYVKKHRKWTLIAWQSTKKQ